MWRGREEAGVGEQRNNLRAANEAAPLPVLPCLFPLLDGLPDAFVDPPLPPITASRHCPQIASRGVRTMEDLMAADITGISDR